MVEVNSSIRLCSLGAGFVIALNVIFLVLISFKQHFIWKLKKGNICKAFYAVPFDITVLKVLVGLWVL